MAKKLAQNGLQLAKRLAEEAKDDTIENGVKAILVNSDPEKIPFAIMALIAVLPIDQLKSIMTMLHNPIVMMQAISNSAELDAEEGETEEE